MTEREPAIWGPDRVDRSAPEALPEGDREPAIWGPAEEDRSVPETPEEGPDRAEEDRSRLRDLCFLPPLTREETWPEGEGSREGGTDSGRESPETEALEDEGDLPPLRSLRT